MARKVEKLQRDHRPYIMKRLHQDFQKRYANWFLRPHFESFGRGCTFMKPWFVEIFGGPVTLGDYCTVIATADSRIRLTVWSAMGQQGAIDIGSYSLICPGVRISAATKIFIGASCMLAQGVFITDSDWHGVYDRSLPVGNTLPVHIEDNVWIGDSAIVCKGVRIGKNSIVGAGSVVVRDIPENVIAAGNPAVVVKYLDADRPIKTRADWLADPKALAAQFEEIDRAFMKNNNWFGWVRSLLFPRRGD
ncbi:MAG: acyltransferase [Syntrophobacterales bacterium]|nr:acyltransferase [Syntrophobacterales bacterium]